MPLRSDEPSPTISVRPGSPGSGEPAPSSAATPPAGKDPAADTFTFAPDLTGAPLKEAVLHQGDLPHIPGYQLLEYVATGGMGIVYRGRDETLDREVAIKLPRAGFLAGEHDKERFVREARAAARLRHPNICPIFEVREAHNRPYIAMAFIQGQTLKEWVQSTRPGPRQIAELVATVARAVQAAHDEGVIHRDLKPSNVMVEQGTGQPILMDFGLAKDLSQTDGLTISGDLVGTPAYMAPEQATGRIRDIGPLTDVYALGAILYELLTGRMPFEGTLAEVLQKVQQAEPESIRRSNVQVHRDLETICVKAMSKRTADRYASAGALAEDLERFARGEPILARRQALATRVARQIQKYPVVWSLAAALLLALGLGAVILPRVWRDMRVNNLGRRLETSLRAGDWNTTRVPEAEAILKEIHALSPAAAEDYRAQFVNRLDAYITHTITDRPRLTEADRLEIDADIEILNRFAPALGAKRGPEADRRFGLWERTVDWRAPFANTASVLPALDIQVGGSGLVPGNVQRGVSKAEQDFFLSTQLSERRQQVEATFECPPDAACGVLLNARQLPPGGIGAVAISADSQLFATGHTGGGAIHLWNSETGDEVQTLAGHERGIGGLAFTPDRKYLLSTGHEGKLQIWDLASGKLHRSADFEAQEFGKNVGAFHAPPLALTGDGGQVFVGTGKWGESGAIRRWTVPDLTPLEPLVHPSHGICRLSYSDSAQRLAAGTAEGGLQVWDVAEAKLLYTAQVHDRSITAVAMRPNGAQVATTSANGLVRIYDAQEPKLLASLQGFEAGVYAMAWHPQAAMLAAGYENGLVKFWNIESGQVVGTLFDRRRRCLSLAFEPQGRWGVAGNEVGSATVWDASSATPRWSLGNQSYAFLVEREGDGSSARVKIQRNGTLLRDVVQQVAGPSIHLLARREGERLTLQVNHNAAVTFTDYFPARPVERGVWGLQLAKDARLIQLTVRSSVVSEDASPLEIGDKAFRAGRFSEALESYDQQIAASVADEQSSIRQEAAIKAASCLVRLNRLNDAIERFKAICTSADASTAAAKLAHFQFWLLYLHQGQFDAADGLAQSILLKYPQASIAEVVPSDLGEEIYGLYWKGIARRRSVLEPGNLERVAMTLRVADYFQLEEDRTEDLAWHAMIAYRTAGREPEAKELARRQLARMLKAPLVFHLTSNVESAGPMESLGFLCRWLDCPERIEQPLDAMLFGEGAQLRPEVQGSAVAAVVERARLHAHRGDWERCLALLQQTEALDAAKIPAHTRVALALLQGFAQRHLGRDEAAATTFRQAFEDSDVQAMARDMDRIASTELPSLVLLAAQGGGVDEEFARRFVAQLRSRMETIAGGEQLFVQLPPSAKHLNEMWRTKKGWEIGERIALGNLLVPEQIKAFLILLGRQMIRQGSVGEQATDEQEELLWQLCVDGFDAYSAGKLSLPTFLQLGLAWKEISPPLGWSFFFQGLPADLRSPVAYALGKRFQARKNAAARSLLTYAKDFSAEDSLARKLAEEALADSALAP